MRPHEHPDASDLLRTEHAVVRVLASAGGEAAAYPGLLAAIGESLGCAGALWLPGRRRRAALRRDVAGGRAAGAELVAVGVVVGRAGGRPRRVRVPAARGSA